MNVTRKAKHRGLATLTLLIVGLSCPAIGASAASSPTPGTSVGFRLVDAPSDRVQDPRAHIYIVDHLAPGTTIHRRVEVSNGTAQAVHIRLYAGAATLEQGQFKAPGGPGGNDLAGWTSVSAPAVDVPPGSAVQATVTIAVPSSAPTGERYGVVWAELPPSQGNGGVSLVEGGLGELSERLLPGGAGKGQVRRQVPAPVESPTVDRRRSPSSRSGLTNTSGASRSFASRKAPANASSRVAEPGSWPSALGMTHQRNRSVTVPGRARGDPAQRTPVRARCCGRGRLPRGGRLRRRPHLRVRAAPRRLRRPGLLRR